MQTAQKYLSGAVAHFCVSGDGAYCYVVIGENRVDGLLSAMLEIYKGWGL